MSIIRWEPLRELSSLQNEVNRLFSTVVDSPTGDGGAGLRRWLPAMDLIEGEEQFVLRADLPGMKREDVSIELEDNVLTIAGERRVEDDQSSEGFRRVERAFGAFSRTLTLPKGIDPEAISAGFEDGVLEVRIPKPEQRKPRRISIGVGEAPKTIEGTGSERASDDEGVADDAA